MDFHTLPFPSERNPIVAGAPAARFAKDFKELLESAALLEESAGTPT